MCYLAQLVYALQRPLADHSGKPKVVVGWQPNIVQLMVVANTKTH